MRILAIDTATNEASVAVRAGERRAERHLVANDFHSSTLLVAIDEILDRTGLAAGALDGVVVTVGPGSFTGLRVGIATAQGIALGAACPVVPIGTLEALALLPDASHDRQLIFVMNAFRGEVFFAEGEAPMGFDTRSLVGPVQRAAFDAFLAQLPAGAVLVGNVAQERREEIQGVRPDVRVWEGGLFAAARMAAWAPARLRSGGGMIPDQLRADYGRGAHIGRPRDAARRT